MTTELAAIIWKLEESIFDLLGAFLLEWNPNFLHIYVECNANF